MVSLETYPKAEWNALGKKLGIKNDTLTKIREKWTDDGTRMESILQHWLDDSQLPTWGNFNEVMNSLGEKRLIKTNI